MKTLRWNPVKYAAVLCVFTSLGVAWFCFQSQSFSSRALASPEYVRDSSRLRMKILPLSADRHPDQKMVLIGMDRTDSPNGFFSTDLSSLGFESDSNFKNFEPLFLMLVDPLGVHEVYTFKIGSFRRDTSGLMPKLKGTWVEGRIKNPHEYPSLPYKLVDVQSPSAGVLSYQSSVWLLELLALTPASPILKPIRMARSEIAHQRSTLTQMLIAYLEEGLESGAFSELKEILSDAQLDRLKGALDVRNGPQNSLWNLLTSNMEDRIKNYKIRKAEIECARDGKSSKEKCIEIAKEENKIVHSDREKLDRVKQAAEAEGLVVIPFGLKAGIIAVDVTRSYDKDKVHRLVSPELIEAVQKKYEKREGGKLVGISAFVADEQLLVIQKNDAPSKLIFKENLSLADTKSQLNEQDFFNVFKLLRTLAYGFIPGPINFGLSYGESWIGIGADFGEMAAGQIASRYDNRWARRLARFFNYKFMDLSELMIASELGYLVPESGDQGKFFAAILDYLSDDLSADVLAEYKTQILSEDLTAQQTALQAVFTLYLNKVDNAQYLMTRTTRRERIEAQSIYTQRLARWMSDRIWKVDCGSKPCHEKKAEQMARRTERALNSSAH